MTNQSHADHDATPAALRFNDQLGLTAEQQARDMLERMGVSEAQIYTAGDLVELANLIAERDQLATALRLLRNAVRAQNRAGTSWPAPVFAQMMEGLARADALLDGPNSADDTRCDDDEAWNASDGHGA
jgi:hypothetical protein